MSPSLQDWVWVEAMLIQAMVGRISPNFREVVLSFKGGEWHLQVTLEKENGGDREEVDDIVDQFGDYMEDIIRFISKTAYARARSEVLVSRGPINYSLAANQRVLFRRREKYSIT